MSIEHRKQREWAAGFPRIRVNGQAMSIGEDGDEAALIGTKDGRVMRAEAVKNIGVRVPERVLESR
jgi:hypothetical protein